MLKKTNINDYSTKSYGLPEDFPFQEEATLRIKEALLAVYSYIEAHGNRAQRYGWAILASEILTGDSLALDDAYELGEDDPERAYNWYRQARHRLICLLRDSMVE